MKKLTSNFFTLIALMCIVFLYSQHSSDELNYWKFVTHNMVLNVGLAAIAITAGLLVKNYLYVIIGASFVLLIYCLTYMFSPGSQMISQFFLAIYTIFLAFSVIANLCRHYKDWVLRES
jgi:peptidoglycan/LPS O-acetylase OafA/YrhL